MQFWPLSLISRDRGFVPHPLPARLPACPPTLLPACPPACLPACLHVRLPSYLPVHCTCPLQATAKTDNLTAAQMKTIVRNTRPMDHRELAQQSKQDARRTEAEAEALAMEIQSVEDQQFHLEWGPALVTALPPTSVVRRSLADPLATLPETARQEAGSNPSKFLPVCMPGRRCEDLVWPWPWH